MIRATLRAMLVPWVVASIVACSEEPPDQPDRGQSSPEPRSAPTAITTPDEKTTGTPNESSMVESTVGGAILRRDEDVLRIGQAELLRSKQGDEIFVRATVRGPAEAKDCYLMEGSTWFALRDAIESEDASDTPAILEASWANPMLTTRFSGGDTLALSFRESPGRKHQGPDPEDTPFFVVCYKVASLTDNVTWYDVAHIEGTP